METSVAESTASPFTPLPDAVCPNCEHRGMLAFTRVDRLPIHNSLVLSNEKDAKEFPRGDLELAFCRNCAFVSNVAFDLSRIRYDPTYEDQQSFSPTFNAFATRMAQDLIDRYDMRGKNIVEIGCGKGDFLALMCELGDNRGVGIDPTALEGRLAGVPGADRVTLVSEHYDEEKHAKYQGDMVVCRHTLEHIPDPLAFMRKVRKAIGDRLDTVVFLEVPDSLRVYDETAYWDVYYEHCSYFTPGSFARLARAAGFEVLNVHLDFDDQYLLLEARPVAVPSERTLPAEESVASIEARVVHYANSFARRVADWRNHLRDLRKNGKRAAIWGSGSKCVAFVTTLGLDDEIDRVVDINPHRHGKFIPGAGIEIAPPTSLVEYKPDEVVVMNPIYVDEIRTMLDEMGVSCRLSAV